MRLPELPITGVLDELINSLKKERAVVVEAAPGAGKSTLVPLALMDAGFESTVMLEPRRIAARALAARMAELVGERVGERVGYQVRFDKVRSNKTRVDVVTEGILTRRLLSDPFLEGTSVVILDELHERSIHTDLCLAFCKELLEVRDDFHVVAMSATLDAEKVATYLGGAARVRAAGRPFPLDIAHQRARNDEALEVQVRRAVRALIAADDDDGGDILVFLPGAREIHRAIGALSQLALEAIPLYGSLPKREQDRVFHPGGARRVICSTNLAETSLTVPRVSAVVDSGLVRVVELDPRSGIERLKLKKTSKRSETQRAGRAGRTQRGRCVRLYSAAEGHQRSADEIPEIGRTDLAPTLMALMRYAPGAAREVSLLDPISDARADQAEALLEVLGACKDGALTSRGLQLSELPVHPRLGAMLLEGAARDQVSRAALIAAAVSERDPGQNTSLQSRLEMLEVMEATGDAIDLDQARATRVLEVKAQLERASPKTSRELPTASDGRLLLAGFRDRVGLADDEQSARLSSGTRVSTKGAAIVNGALFVAPDVDERVRLWLPLDDDELEPDIVRRAIFDPELERVLGVEQRRVGALILSEKRPVPVDDDALDQALVEVVAARTASFLKSTPFFARVRYAAKKRAGLEWPSTDDEARVAALPELCRGLRTLKAVHNIDWDAWLSAQLPYDAHTLLRERFPNEITLASGRRFKVDYASGEPVLAVRVQEFFGTKAHPCVDGDPILLHLLAPNQRPTQVTKDLVGFWSGSYKEVKKDLKARYPKHPWPEDPADAAPWWPGKKRRT